MKKAVMGIALVAGAALLVSFIAVKSGAQNRAGRLDEFVKCTKEKGAAFYGAFWCKHCQNQKKAFGSSARYLKYIECSSPNGTTQSPACVEKGIASYPTWEFADGSRESGELSLQRIAAKTGCPLPGAK